MLVADVSDLCENETSVGASFEVVLVTDRARECLAVTVACATEDEVESEGAAAPTAVGGVGLFPRRSLACDADRFSLCGTCEPLRPLPSRAPPPGALESVD